MSIVDAVAPIELPSKEELEAHDGQWVAIEHGRIVAAGKTARTVWERAHSAGIESPYVVHLPLSTPGIAFY